MQLAATLTASGAGPSTIDPPCSDVRLSETADREGFAVP